MDFNTEGTTLDYFYTSTGRTLILKVKSLQNKYYRNWDGVLVKTETISKVRIVY